MASLAARGWKPDYVAIRRRLDLAAPRAGEPLVEDRVTVNAIGIGFIEGVPGPQADPAVAEVLGRYLPLRRLGSPKDVQGAVVFLAAPTTNYVNAEVVLIDGAIADLGARLH